MAMARLIRVSCEERASCSVVGSGRSLNSWLRCQMKSPGWSEVPRTAHTLSKDLVYLLRPLWVSFKLSLMESKDDLTGV